MARRYMSYNGLELKLRRDGIEKAGTVATLLLDCFVLADGILKAKTVESKKLCLPNKFKLWRKNLIEKEWLVHEDGNYSRHFPGKKLLRYINKEKIDGKELATTYEVEKKVKELADETSKEFRDVKKELSELRMAIDSLINEKNPPITKGKQKMFVLNPVRALSDPDL